MNAEPEYIRLHITPLDSGLLKTYLPTSTSARNISFHTIETFPEKRYGYVDLPIAEADKLKKKLNGAVLKGTKVRIEKARPPADMGSSTKEEKKVKKDGSSKKRKREETVVDGVALSDRKVKRGWTESPSESSKRKKNDRSASKEEKADKKEKEKKEKKRTKSKYTEGEECLLKTKVPPNATRNLPEEDKREQKKRKKNSHSREVTVHEFEKTTKFPSFLKDEGVKGRAGAEEYVDGRGWVDGEGNVVEVVKEKEVNFPEKKSKKAKKQVVVVEEEDSDTSSSGSSSEEEEEEAEEKPKPKHPAKGTTADALSDDSSKESQDEIMVDAAAPKTEAKPAPNSDSDDTSSSGSDSEDGDAAAANTLATPKSTPAHRPTSSSSLKIDIPPQPGTPAGTVHPLEALYKRRKDASQEEAPATQSFSFFGNGGDAEEGDEVEADEGMESTVPLTPYTRQDFEWRNVRSAAPTPDTAHPLRMKNFWADGQEGEEAQEDEEEEQEEDDEAGKPKDATSDFQSWFWENRRDLNRSWMNRRKTAAKEKRHRENKARASRAV